jgi:hypothetical protein
MHLFVNSLEGKLQLIILNYIQNFPLLGMNYIIGLSLHMDSPKFQQIILTSIPLNRGKGTPKRIQGTYVVKGK